MSASWLVCHNSLKRREVTLTCSFRSSIVIGMVQRCSRTRRTAGQPPWPSARSIGTGSSTHRSVYCKFRGKISITDPFCSVRCTRSVVLKKSKDIRLYIYFKIDSGRIFINDRYDQRLRIVGKSIEQKPIRPCNEYP